MNQKTELTPAQLHISKKILSELDRFFDGKDYDFSFVKRTPHRSKFFENVYCALQTSERQSKFSYKQLADISGNPRASRAVGTAMAKNPWPVLVPCHKVVRSSNLGNSKTESFVKSENYSGPGGAETKLFLLKLEGAF